METLIADLRFALRTLFRRPGFLLAALLTLAVGIGANTAVYSIAEAVLLRPLPFRDPERLVFVWERNTVRDRTRNVVNPGNYLEWRDRNTVFDDIAAFAPWDMNLSGDFEPARVDMGAVSANFFSTLGVSPALGRAFSADDAKPGAPDVAILSDGLWHRRFGGDPSVLGRDLILNGEPARIVGVMPPAFQVPPGSELWVPFTEGGDGGLRRDARGRWLRTVARLKAGVTIAQAQGALEGIAAQLTAERPDFNSGWTVFVAPLHADLVRDAKPAVLVLFGAVAALLLIGCGNVANLLLVRALARSREIAVRRALGATPARIVAQLLTESLLLAGAGGALGLVLAAWFKQGLLAVVPAEVQALFAVRLDPKVAAFALGVSVLSALLFGLAPAWHAAGREQAGALHDGTSGAGLSRERRRLTRLVVGAEVALSLMLLVGAGLLLRSFWRLSHENVGFVADGVLSFQVNLSGPRYREEGATGRFYTQALERIVALRGVESAGGMSWRPLGAGSATTFEVPDRPAPPQGQEPVADVRMVTPGLLRSLGIAITQGRDFEARDDALHPTVVVVNETLAREFWPGENPLGRRIRMEWDEMLDAEIVGVVGEVRLVGVDQAPRNQIYWAVSQVPNGFLSFLVKTKGRPADLVGPVKEALAAVDPTVPVAAIAPLDQVVGDALKQPRFTFVLLGAFALTAALLAGLGLFGVLSYSVTQRLREMGVRLALGASPRDVARLVMREGASLALAGALVGLAGALLAAGVLSSLLHQTNPRDPVAFAGVTVCVAVLALLAAAVPAWRASRVDPAVALRAE
jgi:putative ABC transport system permease protein